MRKSKDSSITNILKLIAPGTPIRDGLENILRAKTGALLLITDNNDIIKKVDHIMNSSENISGLYEELDNEIMNIYSLSEIQRKTIHNALARKNSFFFK